MLSQKRTRRKGLDDQPISLAFDVENSTIANTNSAPVRIAGKAQDLPNLGQRLGDLPQAGGGLQPAALSLIHISEPTRPYSISYAVFCLKKKL